MHEFSEGDLTGVEFDTYTMICLPPPPSQGRVNMVTAAVGDIRTMILTIGGIGVQPGPFTCPHCG